MTKNPRIFITDCEGPVSKNDNAFELTSHFVPHGDRFFAQLSRYDDVLADIMNRADYEAGGTLKLILPFLKAFGVTDRRMREFSARNILLMPGSYYTLQFLEAKMPSYILSTSYEPYIEALCHTLDFPLENAYCTRLNIDKYKMDRKDQHKLRELHQEVISMPFIQIPKWAESLEDFSEKDQSTIKRLDEIFWADIQQMELASMLECVQPLGGVGKAKMARKIANEAGSSLQEALYVGDSITDAECFKLVRQHGGITISFNGNAYAIREAEIAVMSINSVVIAVLADVFNRSGRDTLSNMIDRLDLNNLNEYGVSSSLQKKFRNTFPKEHPYMGRISRENMEELTAKSNTFRKLVRGEKVGDLG